MRWSSWFAACLIAATVTLFWQPVANSADAGQESGSWQADVAPDGTTASADPAPDNAETRHANAAPDDPVAVLEAVDYALKEVADGATYVWHRTDGPLQGAVRPYASYRDDTGAVCRRLSVTLTLGATTRWTDATACREPAGRWVIGG